MLIKLSSEKYIPHDRIEIIQPSKDGYDLFVSEDIRLTITQEDLDRIIKVCGLSSKETDIEYKKWLETMAMSNVQQINAEEE